MKYNFDEIVDRRNTNSEKYDADSDKLIKLGVADMDFKTAPCVTEAIIKLAEHGIFGYTSTKKDGDYFKAVQKWFGERFDFAVKPEWLVKTPGVIYSVCHAIRAFTETGDAVMIQPPVYPSFRAYIEANNRRTVENPLLHIDGRYQIDFSDFENKIVENKVKLFILCSPHNPVGRVWTKAELTEMGNICLKHGVIVTADEIHSDFVHSRHRHTVWGSVNDYCLHNSVICTAPSKTFNLPGLHSSNIFIADDDIRSKFMRELGKTSGGVNTMGLISCQAAYENGGEWVDELVKYIGKSYAYIKDYICANLPEIRVTELEGTYLVWLDLNAYGFSETELERVINEKAGLSVIKGSVFGKGGSGFIRVNIGCPLHILKEAFNRLKEALDRE